MDVSYLQILKHSPIRHPPCHPCLHIPIPELSLRLSPYVKPWSKRLECRSCCVCGKGEGDSILLMLLRVNHPTQLTTPSFFDACSSFTVAWRLRLELVQLSLEVEYACGRASDSRSLFLPAQLAGAFPAASACSLPTQEQLCSIRARQLSPEVEVFVFLCRVKLST